MRSAPHSRLCAAICLIKLIVSGESLGFLACTLDLRFGEHAEKLPVPAKKRFRLNKEERLFPAPNYPDQQHQEQPIRLSANGSFDLSTKDDQLLP
jgi:hypothetical protein